MVVMRSHVPRAQGDGFKLLVLSEYQFKTQRHSIYSHIKQRKAENPKISRSIGQCMLAIFT